MAIVSHRDVTVLSNATITIVDGEYFNNINISIMFAILNYIKTHGHVSAAKKDVSEAHKCVIYRNH